MPEYLSPGVYVEEVSSGAKPIEGVSTSTAGFVGPTERGPLRAKLLTSWLDYQRWYGSYIDPAVAMLPFAVDGFFQNGGKRLFVARAAAADAEPATAAGVGGSFDVEAIGPGTWGNRVRVLVADSPAVKDPDNPKDNDPFQVVVRFFSSEEEAQAAETDTKVKPEIEEQFNDLTVVDGASNNVVTVINATSKLIQVAAAETPMTRPTDLPVNEVLADGTEGEGIDLESFTGASSIPPDLTGLKAFEAIDEISILASPDAVNGAYSAFGTQIIDAMNNQCLALKDRFLVTDIAKNQTDVATLFPPIDTDYGAVYYPWIRVFDPSTNRPVEVPPSGAVVGLYARTDVDRGVWKAPANEVVRNLYLSGDGPLEFRVTKGEQDLLNPRGVNVIRDFQAMGRGIRVWGARTMSSDPEWRYVNVRRLFIYVEESIDKGTQWVVFEPNNEPTWTKVVTSISGFLNTLWRSGGLMGTTPEEAYFVVCDRTTMTQDDIDNGRLICNVGIAPVKPAEFVIIRIGQKTMEAA